MLVGIYDIVPVSRDVAFVTTVGLYIVRHGRKITPINIVGEFPA